MKKMTHNEIRNTWINYFTKHGHKLYESASLIPIDDDSLLWVNAGVTPLKKYFDGRKVPESKRMVTIQKCIRTNDIENVGITKRHQTFFEMMGNFSVGDYFREEAIEFAYDLLTNDDYFGIDKNLLYVTYYPNDLKTKNRWIELGLNESHLIPIKENFWEIGEGPCGPDTEIFFDRGEKYDTMARDALDRFKKDMEQERYVEIWNVVLSQFNAEENKPREAYKELPNKNIDTGAGLERWCCIFQDVDSNFETDLFKPIIEQIELISKNKYSGQKEFKIIADHIRAITFALADGESFDNTGRGYVLRRLLRRSVRFGKNIGITEPFMYKLVSTVIEIMQQAYPYLNDKKVLVETLILEEEKLFLKTLNAGERRLEKLIDNSNDKTISGEDVFKLYDTYGFPYELTEEYLKERGYQTSKEEFNKYMEMQKELGRKSNKNSTSMASQEKVLLDFKDKSSFVYNLYRVKSKVIAILSHSGRKPLLDKDGYIVLERTPFYAESGGQVSDTGMIIGENFKARVLDVVKGPNGQHIHKVKLLDGIIKPGDSCEGIVDAERRKKIEINHSSVHILQYSLQQVVSSSIHQAGSYVDDNKLRFDFTYSGKLTEEKIIDTEKFANEYAKRNIIVSTEIMPKVKAKELGAMALFDEKYEDNVRVVKIGKSIELCGGTHTSNTKNIKKFAITNVESKGSNIYRIEATTNDNINKTLSEIIKPYYNEMVKLLLKARNILEEAKKEDILLEFDINIDENKPESYKDIISNRNMLKYIQNEVKELEKKFFEEKEKKSLKNLDKYLKLEKDLNGTKSIIMKTNNEDSNLLKSIMDTLVNNKKDYLVFIANIKSDNSVHFLCRTTSDKLHAGLLVKAAANQAGGNGGGKPTFAEGGGKTKEFIDQILKMIEDRVNNDK